MRSNFIKVLICAIVILLIGALVVIRQNKVNVETIKIADIEATVKKNDYSVVFFGDIIDENLSRLKWMHKNYNVQVYIVEATIDEFKNYYENQAQYVVDDSKTAQKEHEEYLDSLYLPKFVFYTEDTLVDIWNTGEDDSYYRDLLEKYIEGKIPASEIAYKTPAKADDFIKLVNSKKYTVAVFGYEGCSFCNLYVPIFNEVAKDYGIDIYYFDRDNYDNKQFTKIMDLNLDIPAECTLDGLATSTAKGFPKPMTLITKSGKTVDCLRGYVSEATLVAKLQEYAIIKDQK